MRTLIFFISIFVIGFGLFQFTNASNQDAANFIIEVKDANNNTVAGALVTISMGTPQSSYTGSSGKALFNITQTGTYTLCGVKNNLSDVDYHNVSSIPPPNHFGYLTIVENGPSCPIGGVQP